MTCRAIIERRIVARRGRLSSVIVIRREIPATVSKSSHAPTLPRQSTVCADFLPIAQEIQNALREGPVSFPKNWWSIS